MPDSRPRIVFNKEGICNACENANLKNEIDWSKRKNEFDVLIKIGMTIIYAGYCIPK